MYTKAADTLKENSSSLSEGISTWVKNHHPDRTSEYDKCARDVKYIIDSLELCLRENTSQAIDYIAKMFFRSEVLQLKSVHVEFQAYDILALQLEILLKDAEEGSAEFCKRLLDKLKDHLSTGFETFNTKGVKSLAYNRETNIKRMFYNWDREMEIIRDTQKCQRNWDLSRDIHPEMIDYLLWHAENAPSKQHEAYYDVYWTADRKVIEECSKYTWGSTHSRNPPSTWRNTQANANMYMLFVAKEPETQLNCHADGSLKSNKDPARWENAYVSIGIAMGLVMRAANSLGFATGCNKSHGDINGDNFWEEKLGILEDVKAGRKKIAYGIGIGYPQQGRPRWETDDYELAIGSGNGSNLTTLTEEDPEWQDTHPRTGRKFRKVKIVDIRTTNKAVDPYGVIHDIPSDSSIKINTMRKRIINITEIK